MVALGLVILSVASTLTIFAVLGLRP